MKKIFLIFILSLSLLKAYDDICSEVYNININENLYAEDICFKGQEYLFIYKKGEPLKFKIEINKYRYPDYAGTAKTSKYSKVFIGGGGLTKTGNKCKCKKNYNSYIVEIIK